METEKRTESDMSGVIHYNNEMLLPKVQCILKQKTTEQPHLIIHRLCRFYTWGLKHRSSKALVVKDAWP